MSLLAKSKNLGKNHKMSVIVSDYMMIKKISRKKQEFRQKDSTF